MLSLATSVPAPGQESAQHRADPKSWVRYWNRVAIDASGLDHTPVAPGENRVFGEQIGPCRASRAMAIVHIALFDTIVAVMGEVQSYTGVRAPAGAFAVSVAGRPAGDRSPAFLFSVQTRTFGW